MDWRVVRAGVEAMGIVATVAWRMLKGYPYTQNPGLEPDPNVRAYATTAASCGLTQVEHGDGLSGPTLKGHSGSFPVRLELHRVTDGETRWNETRLLIQRGEGRPVPLTLRRQGPGLGLGPLERDLSAREIEVGDKGFDDEFIVNGPHTFVRALLDAPTRRLLRNLLLETDLQVTPGHIGGRMVATASWMSHERALGRMLGFMLELARHFERPRDVVKLLCENARRDPLPEVRLQNLLTLVREYPEEPLTDEALVAACGDTSDWIRVRAATALGARGQATLLEVASREPPDDLAAPHAIGVLGKALPPDRVREILGRALRSRQEGTARACLAALGHGSGDAVALLAKVMGVERGEVAVAAADALASTGSPAAEAPLLAALERDIPELRRAAARALGRVGTVAAVVTLKEAEAKAPDADFKRDARQAIAEIQARLPGASPGQLSIASGEAGQLSIVEDERGRLSLPGPDEGK